mmetsp:Transcript_39085/g.98233  ORF Transcript_39085/g.98233 Transcript_39085/m.98233 type:complete len:338 (-) Transcript_39085:124-1137(-)
MASVPTSFSGHADGCAAMQASTELQDFGEKTTIMVRNLPRKFRGWDLVAEFEPAFPRETFNFLYVPWDRNSTSNMGYAFVNFTDPLTAFTACKTMDGLSWKVTKTSRLMKLVPANVQGLAANLKRYSDSKSEPDSSHSPLLFHRGVHIPLQLALQIYFPTRPPSPAWYQRQEKVKEEAWSVASTTDGASTGNSIASLWDGGVVGHRCLGGETVHNAQAVAGQWGWQAQHVQSCFSAEPHSNVAAQAQLGQCCSAEPYCAKTPELGGCTNSTRSSFDYMDQPEFVQDVVPINETSGMRCMQAGFEMSEEQRAIMASPGYIASSQKVSALLLQLKAHGF